MKNAQRETSSFTQGSIAAPLLRFAVPVLLAMFLQSLYGAIDLLVIGRFCTAADVSAVATGSQLMQMVTVIVTGLAMGITIAVGHAIGEKDLTRAGNAVGAGLRIFFFFSLGLTVLLLILTKPALHALQTPAEAFQQAVYYVAICSAGSVFIVFYNVLGSVFRGVGDSKTPLIIVFCAAICNAAGDVIFIALFHMRAVGAALATVLAQAISVCFCLWLIHKKGFPFPFGRNNLHRDGALAKTILKLGSPIALQDGLVAVSFLAINAIVNTLGVIPSAGVGVAEKVCAFLMLVPSTFSQSLSAFVAQNIGAGKTKRARKSMVEAMLASLPVGLLLSYLTFFHGSFFSAIFTTDTAVISAAADYLKAYAVDILIVSFLFCFIGFFNGRGDTTFVMVQGIIGAFAVRIPISFMVSRLSGATLFHIGLATPASTIVQILLCLIFYAYTAKKQRGKGTL